MSKLEKAGFCLLAIIVLASVFTPIIIFIHNTQTPEVVATIDGIKLYYNNEIYTETDESFYCDRDEYLGVVDFLDSGTRLRMYSIRNMPDYIFVDMGITDYRIYKIKSEEK